MKTINVAAAIICRDNKILATARGYGEFKGMWEFPGGKIEEGEQPKTALKREIHEELNAEIHVHRHLTTVEYDYPAFHLTMQCYLCAFSSVSFELKEHLEARWLSKTELRTVNWLPADIQLLEALENTDF
ncbi:MAG: (deoxy)nucleoside triphosphate pyrophosphohydrolase [Oscillospiraceae bacterium]|nr:(deoxy)nucleoside triphosphate pyrophosphohydrolase [Oscillospiraceae bacterium]